MLKKADLLMRKFDWCKMYKELTDRKLRTEDDDSGDFSIDDDDDDQMGT